MHQQSRQRMAADNQFLKLQTQSLSKGRMMSEIETVSQKRAENTARLRGLRLAKEEQDRTALLAAPPVSKKRRKLSKI